MEALSLGLLLVFMFGVFLQACYKRSWIVLGVVGNPSYDALLSSTIANYRDTFADNISQSFFLMYWLTTQGRKIMEDGGESIIVQLMYGKNSTVRSYDGYEPLDVTPQEGMTSAKYPWKQVSGSISISRKEERQNSGEQRIINLLESKVKQAEISMRDTLNAMLYADGSGNGSKDIFGLDLLVEDGAAWGTLAGIDRSDAANAWWRNQYINGALTTLQADMTTLYNRSSRGNEHPDFGVTTQTIYEKFESNQLTNQRFMDSRVADVQFELLKFKGMVLGWDEQCSADSLFMLNSAYLGFVVDTETDLITTDFIRPDNQDAKTAQILLMANLVASNCARQGCLRTVT